jgi:hypothetical protein
MQPEAHMKNSILAVLVIAAGCAADSATSDEAAADGKGDQASANGSVKTLECSAAPYMTFRAKLDSSGWDPGSGFFSARNARIIDNYASASLICTGHTLTEIDCIGFWFDISEQVAEVTTQDNGGGLTASYVSLKGDLVNMSTPPWACTVQ